MILHPLLKRQLKRIQLQQDQAPSLEQWNEILTHINRSYYENDQERYLIERSMEVSSRETSELNAKLERAQQIAHLGYWQYDRETGLISFSKEMYHLFGLDESKAVPSYEELMNQVNEADRNQLANLIDRAFAEGEGYKFEGQIKTFQGTWRWCYLAGNPHPTTDGSPIRYLSGIMYDITHRKEADEKLHSLTQQLIESARKAGMAEIATNVLHNIGNILNSLNISIELIQEYLESYNVDNIVRAIQMIMEHLPSLEDYLTNDPKGKLLPNYLLEASKLISNVNKNLHKEVRQLVENVSHIKTIVKTQIILSGMSTIMENVCINDVVEDALLFHESAYSKHGITFKRNYENVPFIVTDKNKVMQILLNLIQNAKDAILLSKVSVSKIITLNTHLKTDKKNIEVGVSDTGIGIAPAALEKIFTFGFTTKPDGHGFGLHSSMTLAKELGGRLRGESEGIGQGAKFILTLPLKIKPDRRKSP